MTWEMEQDRKAAEEYLEKKFKKKKVEERSMEIHTEYYRNGFTEVQINGGSWRKC